MSSPDAALDLSPTPSKTLMLVTLVAGLLSLMGIGLSNLHWPLAAALTFAVLVSCSFHILCLLGKIGSSIRQVQYFGEGWWISLADGRTLKADLAGPIVVLPYLVRLGFRVGNERFDWVVLASSLSQTEHRRLRVTLRQLPARYQRFSSLAVTRWYKDRIAGLFRQ